MAPVPPDEYASWLFRLQQFRRQVEAAVPSDEAPSHEQIAECAERIWIEGGRRNGTEHEDWRAAEMQLARQRPSLEQAIGNIENGLTARTVKVTFGGNQKAGKSTLVNGALGRLILPFDDLPETGVACYVSAADDDDAVVIWDTHARLNQHVPCEMAMLRDFTALQPERVRRGLELPERVEVRLRGTPIPVDVCWVDVPGLDDTAEMTECAARAIEDGDVLFFVSASDQFLSDSEVSYLTEHVARYGAASVVVVLNVFRGDASAGTGKGVYERKLRRMRARASEREVQMGFTADSPLHLHAVDAHALTRGECSAEGATGFLRELIAIASPEHPRVRRTRIYKTAYRVRQIAERLRARRIALQEKESAAVLTRAAAAERFRCDVEEFVTELVGIVARRVRDAGATISASVTDAWDALSISATCRYDRMLEAEAARALALELPLFLEKLGKTMQQHGQPGALEEVGDIVGSTLSMSDFNVLGGRDISKVGEGAELASTTSGVIAAMLAGAATLGFGTLVAAGVGAALGRAARQREQSEVAAQTRSRILSSIHSEVNRAAKTLLGKRGALVEHILHVWACTTDPSALSAKLLEECDMLGILHAEASALEQLALQLCVLRESNVAEPPRSR